MQIWGEAAGSGFAGYRLEYGVGLLPDTWQPIAEGTTPMISGLLARWPTLGLDDGDYTLRLTVFDGAVREEADSIPVKVDNTAPVVQWVFPAEGALLDAGPVRLVAEASDNLGLAQVDFFVGEELVGSVAAPPFAVDWQATAGSYRLKVEAHDRAGSMAISVIRVNVQ